MKARLVQSFVLIFVACGPVVFAQSSSRPATAALSAKTPEAVSPPALSATVVEYGERDVLRLKAKLRYSTLIVLPKNEQILDFTMSVSLCRLSVNQVMRALSPSAIVDAQISAP